MKPQDKKRLERIAKDLTSALEIINEILSSEGAVKEDVVESTIDFNLKIDRLKAIGRTAAEAELQMSKSNELGSLFVATGGSAADKKKPKVWLIEQILWRLFDFERGHEAIRGGR